MSTYSIEYLGDLRERLIIRYKSNMKSIGKNDYIEFPNNKNSKYYDLIQTDIENHTGIKVSTGTLLKFLYRNNLKPLPEAVKYLVSTIDTFKRYSQIIENNTNKIIYNTNTQPQDSIFAGSYLIDEKFVSGILENNYTMLEFYTAKQSDFSQWYGVIKEWDAKRTFYSELKVKLIKLITTERTSIIPIMICGESGSGKSILLRRLALDLVGCDLKCLWIHNLKVFTETTLETILKDFHQKYVLIIDDWYNQKDNDRLTIQILDELTKVNHIQLLIGDRETVDRVYCDYLIEDNVYYLDNEDNEKILQKVSELNQNWKELFNTVIAERTFLQSSIYLILFVTIWNYEQNSKISNSSLISSLPNIKSIIRNDLIDIYELSRGLGLALYHYANINSEYRVHFTWHSFLIIADYFQGDSNLSNKLFDFNGNDELLLPLFKYIHLEKLIRIPGNIHVVKFHNELLVTLGLIKQPKKNWGFSDNNTHLEIMELLINKSEKYSVLDFARRMGYESFFYEKIGFWAGCSEEGLSLLMEKDNRYRRMFQNVLELNEEFWADSIFIYLVFAVDDYKTMIHVLKQLIHMGSQSRIVHETHIALIYHTDGSHWDFIARISKIPGFHNWLKLKLSIPEYLYREELLKVCLNLGIDLNEL